MKVTLDIDVSNSKALALLNYIKTLDFIKVDESDSSVYNEALSNDQIQVLEQRKEYHAKNKSKMHNWDDVKDELRNSMQSKIQCEDAIFAQLGMQSSHNLDNQLYNR